MKKGSAVLVDGELQSRNWKSDDGHNRSIVEIKARRIQFLNKRLKNDGENDHVVEADEPEVFSDDENTNFSNDSFDKFLSNEESNLIN